jgi:hypothetical protein
MNNILRNGFNSRKNLFREKEILPQNLHDEDKRKKLN